MQLVLFKMDSVFAYAFIVFIIFAIYYIIRWYMKLLTLPPGPAALPLIGTYQLRVENFQLQLANLAKKYPTMMRLFLGPYLTIVINDIGILKEAFGKKGESILERPDDFLRNIFSEGKGIVSGIGEVWKEQRRFALHLLRDLGFGKVMIEERIGDIANDLHIELLKYNKQPVDLHWIIVKTISNVISSIVLNTKYSYEDDTFEKLFSLVEENLNTVHPILNNFGFIYKIPGDPFGYNQLLINRNKFFGWIDSHIEDRKQNFDGKNVECFVDSYLQKLKAEADNPGTSFTHRQLQFVVGDLFVAGTDTTATTIRWALLLMAANTDIQDKVRHEIWETIGKDRTVSTRERNLLPYTDATINEVIRLYPVAPFGVPHYVTKPVELDGYSMPVGTTVLPNFYWMLRDPKLFGHDAELFNPERFLETTEHGLSVKKIDGFLPFSTGKRICLGESLAKMESFIFFTTLIQHFKFTYPEEDSLDLDGVQGFLFKPSLHRLIPECLD